MKTFEIYGLWVCQKLPPFSICHLCSCVSIPQPVSAKRNWVALNRQRSSLPAHPTLNEMSSGTIAWPAVPAVQKGLQPLRRRSDNEQLEKETSSAQKCADSEHIWLQPEPTIFCFPIHYSWIAILLFFLAVPTCIVPECLSPSDIKWRHEELFFSFLLLCSENSTHLEVYQILSVCGIYSFLPPPTRDPSCPEGLCLKLQSFLSDLVPVLSSVCLMSNTFSATKIGSKPYLSLHVISLEQLSWKQTCPWLPWRLVPGVISRAWLGITSGHACFKALLQAEDASATEFTHLLL